MKTVNIPFDIRDLRMAINGSDTLIRWYRAHGHLDDGLVIDDVKGFRDYLKGFLKDFQEDENV